MPANTIIPSIIKLTGAKQAILLETVQSLWSGYGRIDRYQLIDGQQQTVIVKQISPPSQQRHPRGWNTDFGHKRKLRSYQVETTWYTDWAQQCTSRCRVPRCLGIERNDESTLLILEDLDRSGFPVRRSELSNAEFQSCLRWLAHFHARFLGHYPTGLWPVGSYWHLDTRPDEWNAMAAGPLMSQAARIDSLLRQAHFQTLVHGDAKLANFCFSEDGFSVAAVDFQYVGGGCGIRDLAYFMGSCLDEVACEQHWQRILADYFREVRSALELTNPTINITKLEQEWRRLFPLAWADFQRFLLGWMPSHKKINRFSNAMTEQALALCENNECHQ